MVLKFKDFLFIDFRVLFIFGLPLKIISKLQQNSITFPFPILPLTLSCTPCQLFLKYIISASLTRMHTCYFYISYVYDYKNDYWPLNDKIGGHIDTMKYCWATNKNEIRQFTNQQLVLEAIILTIYYPFPEVQITSL